MSRLLKLLSLTGMTSVYLMQAGTCTTGDGGLSILPNIGTTFTGLGL